MSAGFEYESSSGRDTAGLGNAWGTRGGSLLRGIFNAVIPVTIVERWYGKLDGSLFAQTAGTPGSLGFRPAVEFFSQNRDWELHAINISYPVMADVGLTAGPPEYRIITNLFTAFAGFNPIEFNPTVLFGPQLITNDTFNQGTVRGQGGVAPVDNPLGFGLVLADVTTRVGVRGSFGAVPQKSDSYGRSYVDGAAVDQPIASDKKLQNQITFRRPMRILRGRRITVQLNGADNTFSYDPLHSLQVSILYTELPNPRGSFST